MARLKVLLFAVVAVGLMYWSVSASGGATQAAAQQADAQLAQVEKGVGAAVAAESARQSAAAAEVTHDTALVAALADAAGKDGPTADDAPALKAALEQALAKLPETDRAWAAAAMATSKGAVAILPGHDPLTAESFAWLDEAAKAGAAGKLADVAGRKVQVFAAPVRAVKADKVEELGTVAVAYGRDASGFAKLVEQFPGLTIASGGKVLASSDKAHAEEAAKLGAGSKALVTGQPESFLMKLPTPAATLVQARAFALPGAEGMTAVATADLTSVASATAAGQKAGLMGMLIVLVLGVVFAALSGGAQAAASQPQAAPMMSAPPPAPEPMMSAAPPPMSLPSEPEPAPEPMASAPSSEPTPPRMPAAMPAEPPPPSVFDDKPLVFNPPAEAPAPVQVAPPPAPSMDGLPAFDELFGAAKAAAPVVPAPMSQSDMETRAAMPVPAEVAAAAAAVAAAPADVERTGLMSRDMVRNLAAQSAAMPTAPTPTWQSMPGDGAHQQEERTTVATIPPELLRAAARAAAPAQAALSAEEQHFQDIFKEFVQTRERCGEPPENLTFEKFAAKLRKNKEQLVQKYACKSVRFQVYVKEGKAALKATPVKEA